MRLQTCEDVGWRSRGRWRPLAAGVRDVERGRDRVEAAVAEAAPDDVTPEQGYHVLSVIYADRIWTSWAAFVGRRDYVHPSGPTRDPVLRHLDHVHVAVESGERYRG